MRTPARLLVPVLAVALLSACAVPGPGEGSNPLSDAEKIVDLIPWAKSVAADADANVVVQRIEEIKVGLPSLDIPAATRTEVERRLAELGDAVQTDPSDAAAHVAELNAILTDIAAAL